MTNRRAFLTVLAGGLLAARLAAEAQQAGKGSVIGFLHPGVPDPVVPAIVALRQGLPAFGYIEGQNIRLEYRWAGGRLEKLPGLAADLVRLNVDEIFAVGPQAIRTALGASRTVPIVGSDLEGDPIESGFVASYARPGGNKHHWPIPRSARIDRQMAATGQRGRARDPARRGPLGCHDWSPPTSGAHGRSKSGGDGPPSPRNPTTRGVKTAMRGRPHALIQLSSSLIRQASRRVAEFTVENRLPAISMFIEFAASGGLMAYGPDLPLFFRRGVSLVDRILNGARPAELPIERPEKFELVINLKTAKALGLTIPASLLQRADQVIA